MEPKQVLPIRVIVDWRVIEMKKYYTLSRTL